METLGKFGNLEKIVQCPNELKSNFTGVVVWPEIVSQEYPIVQWLELPVFERNLKIWVKEVYKNPYRIMEPAVKSLDQKRAMAEKLYEHLGWVMMSNRCQTLINREHLKLYYEHDHSGKINGWYQKALDNCWAQGGNASKIIRGPVILMQNMHNDHKDNQVSLNYHRVNLTVMKEFFKIMIEEDGSVTFEDYYSMMDEGLCKIYDKCPIKDCECKIKKTNIAVRFKSRIRSQYNLLAETFSGKLLSNRAVFNHQKARTEIKMTGMVSENNTLLKQIVKIDIVFIIY